MVTTTEHDRVLTPALRELARTRRVRSAAAPSRRLLGFAAALVLAGVTAACAGGPGAGADPAPSDEVAESADSVEGETESMADEPAPGPDSETLTTSDGESQLALHTFGIGDNVDGPSCVPGVYDVHDHDLQSWYTRFAGGTGGDVLVGVHPGSGGVMRFGDNGSFTMELVVNADMVVEGQSATTSASGSIGGTWGADDVLSLRYQEASVSGSITLLGQTLSLPDVGPEILAASPDELVIQYECYNTGVLSLAWPTNTAAGSQIIDLIER